MVRLPQMKVLTVPLREGEKVLQLPRLGKVPMVSTKELTKGLSPHPTKELTAFVKGKARAGVPQRSMQLMLQPTRFR
jgi:hypothetical protein